MQVETLKIEGTQDIPEVSLDESSGRIEFSGRSLPEDVEEVYDPILEWIDKYIENPKSLTHIIFRFDYFNTASSKKILDIIEKMKGVIAGGNDLKIDWYYVDNDEDMLDAGESFSDFVDVPFNFISY